MSRIRSIHPGFFTDDKLVCTSMAARLLLIGLGVEADDKGTFEWKPLTLKMRIFPADNLDIDALLAELVSANAIQPYEIGGRVYGAIRNFRKFQRPKSPNDTHPATPEIRIYVGLEEPNSETEFRGAVPFPPNGEMKADKVDPFPPNGEIAPQMEDGGCRMEDVELSTTPHIELKKQTPVLARARKTRLPEPFVPVLTDKAQAIATRIGPERYSREVQRFADHHRAKGSTMLDWQAAFRTWLSRCEDYDPGRRRRGYGDRPSGWLA